MTHDRPKLGARPYRGLGGIPSLGQYALGFLGDRHVGEASNRRAILQRFGPRFDDAVVRQHNPIDIPFAG